MEAQSTRPDWSLSQIVETARLYWGFDTLRPLQEEAIRAGLDNHDSVVVMPTGGGKSLCYQVPPVLANRTDIVVSPLISLMKDQVDGLRQCDYPAVALHGGTPPSKIPEIEREITEGRYRLVFAAPERLLTPRFMGLLEHVDVRAFAIDEAHCISHWGHDFRPEYRRLAMLKERFGGTSVHAYTATATQRVRDDIAEQLKLRNPTILVGQFDRPNLVYRVVPRVDVHDQVLEVVRRHAGQAVIVYCITRKDTEAMATTLKASGVRAEYYHAGMRPDQRRRTQDAFSNEQIDVVIATVAFGMGIDRSDVRSVIHAAMPKSIEHYQQETGRAGRDGLEAECVLFYSPTDAMRWQSLIEKSAQEAGKPEEVTRAAFELLEHVRHYCGGIDCRHRVLSEYFGQEYENDKCGACDICLDEREGVEDATEIAQKILSCVARVEQRFGVGHVVDVLTGAKTDLIRGFRHDQLSTYGLLAQYRKKPLTSMVYQLVDLGLLDRTAGDRPLLKLNAASWKIMRGEHKVRMVQPKRGAVARTRFDKESWDGVDGGLFDSLRELRRAIAAERGVPPYIVFNDATLRDMARVRPGSDDALLKVHGVGERKLKNLGPQFLQHIASYCAKQGLSLDVAIGSRPRSVAKTKKPNPVKREAFEMFARRCTVEQVMSALGRARSTTMRYLAEYVERENPKHLDPWIDAATAQTVTEAAAEVGTAYFKPIFDKLGGTIPYDAIRLVVTHLNASRPGRRPRSHEPV